MFELEMQCLLGDTKWPFKCEYYLDGPRIQMENLLKAMPHL